MSENIKNEASRLEDEAFLVKFREVYSEAMDDARNKFPTMVGKNNPEKIALGEKIQSSRSERDILIRIGQDFRLTPEEIDILEDKIFEKN